MHASIPIVPGKVMVVGFLFNQSKTLVALINKSKPIWQKGKLNGIGGKIETETSESPLEAMEREWTEETMTKPLILGGGWTEFCQMTHGPNFIFFFKGVSSLHLELPRIPDTVEQADWYDVRAAADGRLNVVENLRWLIPMALDDHRVTCKVHDPTDAQC